MMSVLFFCILGQTSPHPVMGSSAVMETFSDSFRSLHGFEMSDGGTGWQLLLPARKDSLIYRVYRGSNTENPNSPPTLTIRVENLKKNMKPKSYVKRWVREYPYYGFKILGSRWFRHKGARGFLIDVANEERSHKLRQAIFLKKNKAVVMTCSDREAEFHKTYKACNQIIKTFRWSDTKKQLAQKSPAVPSSTSQTPTAH